MTPRHLRCAVFLLKNILQGGEIHFQLFLQQQPATGHVNVKMIDFIQFQIHWQEENGFFDFFEFIMPQKESKSLGSLAEFFF